MSRFRFAAGVAVIFAAAFAAGCASDRVVAPAEMRGGVLAEAYSHKTLYTFAGDQKTGDKNGDGVNGVWHVAR
jgi:predicted lipoprotein with Yx(FWY)xxD motif